MARIFGLTLAIAALLSLTGCNTKNIGGNLPTRGPQNLQITVPSGLFVQNNADFSASWDSGIAPFTILWDFGRGADPNNIGPVAATSPDKRTVLFTNNAGGTFNVSITLTDASGFSTSISTSFTYGSGGEYSPVLTVVAGEGTASITIHGYDANADAITVTATAPAGLSTSPTQVIPPSFTGGDVTFNFTAEDIFAGGSGTAIFNGDDGQFYSNSTVDANVVVPPVILAPDTLYAIPLQPAAAVGDTVTILVATGVPASPFQFMNGCRVTAPTGFKYEPNTFNIGVVGGGAGDVDGYWVGMNPGGGFLLAPDNFIVGSDIGGGLTGIDFNVTPIAGSDLTKEKGALFNFGATFAAGTNTLGFQAVMGVNRTYYIDSNATPDRFWADISNNHAGVPNCVTVQ